MGNDADDRPLRGGRRPVPVEHHDAGDGPRDAGERPPARPARRWPSPAAAWPAWRPTSQTCDGEVERSLAMATGLNPYIGYEQAAELAKEAIATRQDGPRALPREEDPARGRAGEGARSLEDDPAGVIAPSKNQSPTVRRKTRSISHVTCDCVVNGIVVGTSGFAALDSSVSNNRLPFTRCPPPICGA